MADDTEPSTQPGGIPYKRLSQVRNPDYQAGYWEKIRALYAGGQKLLGNKKLLETVFPRHLKEPDWLYDERRKRAFYIPYVGQLIDFIVAALSSHEVELTSTGSSDSYYEVFADNLAKPGGTRMSLQQLLRQQILTALLLKRAWTLIDLPKANNGAGATRPLNRADEDALGLRSAYAVVIEPECVLDWERDEESGELLWVLLCSTTRKRTTLDMARDHVVETYTHYTSTDWTRYVVEYDEKDGQPVNQPKDEALVNPSDGGPHSFGRVPLVCLELDDGLWAGGKIESIATEHFNKRCALSWGQYKSLFQFIAVNLQGPTPNDPISEDTGRATNQIVGAGKVWVGAEKDQIRYVSPDAEPFKVAMEDLAALRDEMHRVLHQMALSQPNSAAALQRSAESKQVDQAATTVVLKRLGQICREYAVDVFEMVSFGRGESDIEWTAIGMDDFDELSSTAFVDEALNVEGLDIPSESFWCDYKYDLVRKLRPSASDDELDRYYAELKKNVTAENASQRDLLAHETRRVTHMVDDGEDDSEDDGDVLGGAVGR